MAPKKNPPIRLRHDDEDGGHETQPLPSPGQQRRPRNFREPCRPAPHAKRMRKTTRTNGSRPGHWARSGNFRASFLKRKRQG